MDGDKLYFTWANLNEEWIGAYYTWDDVAITTKVSQAFGFPGVGVPGDRHVYLPPQEIVKQALTGKESPTKIECYCIFCKKRVPPSRFDRHGIDKLSCITKEQYDKLYVA